MCSGVLILALESSCDETAAAVVEATPDPASACGLRLRARADAVASQAQIHNSFGGVVPEVASRQHLLHVLPVIDQALREAGVGLDAIGGLAVTRGPGLIGALLVAVQTAKAIAFARGLPLVGVNHLEGHLLAPYLDDEAPPLPHLGVLVSGGHTLLVRCDRRPPDGAFPIGAADYRVLGSTRDDAAGEAFDKGGKLLGLGYPAGPVIDRLARGGDPGAVVFPRPMTGPRGGLDFSYSGLKTALAAHLQSHGRPPTEQGLADLCASYQAAIVEQLVRKATLALRETRLRALTLTGGVACNSALRAAMKARCDELGVRFCAAAPRRCTDNAAMIGAAGALRLFAGERADLTLCAAASLPLQAHA